MPFAQYAGRGFSSSRRSRNLPDTSDSRYDVNQVNRSIENAITRIRDAGYNVSDADDRNWLEKATNLPENQNAFFDILELLGRGGNAVKNVIDKSFINKNQDAFTAFGRGLAGRDKVDAADLVEHFGVDNSVAKALLGFGLDVALDPITYVPGAAFAKVAGAVGSGARTAARAGLGAAERISPGFARFRQDRLQPALEGARDSLGRMFVPDYKLGEDLYGRADDTITRAKQQTENRIAFMKEESAKNVADTAKAAGGIDTGADVGRIMERDLRQFEDVPMYEFPDGLGRTSSRRELESAASARRQQVEDIGKDLRNIRSDPIPSSTLKAGDTAYALRAKTIPATNKRPERTEYVRPKGAKLQKVEEVRDVNGVKEFRLSGSSAFIPSSQVQAAGRTSTTEVGELNKAISVAVKELDRTDQQLRRLYFSRENAELRKLTKQKNKPADLDQVAQSRAFQQVGASPAFNLLLRQRDEIKNRIETLRADVKAKRQVGIDQIRALNTEIEQYREAVRNPVMVQREIPRPQREYSLDPAVNTASRNLMRSNQELRQWALDNGVSVGELEGYMKHILSKTERAERKKIRSIPIDRGNRGVGQPNKKVVNEREITGSAEDVNERIGREFFEPNAFFATAIGQKQLIEYANAAAFRRQVLSNPNFAKRYEKGMNVPDNAVVIDTNNYKFLPDDMGELGQEIGGEYLVTKSVKAALDRYKRLTDDEGINGFLISYDKLQSGWKRMALFSPLYHLRNDVGAKFNNWVGGMSLSNLAKYSAQADKEVYKAVVRGDESPMFREFREQGLGSTGLSAVDFARRGEDPEEAIRRTIDKRSRLDGTLVERVKAEVRDLKNPLNAFETSRHFGDFVDQTNRYALYKWARETKGMSPEQAAAKVREVQFDYSKTTPFEREFATRLMPFYRWMRNNLPFQVRSFMNDPRKFINMDKLRQNAQDAVGIEEENVPDWMKESFAFPVYGEDGSGKFIALNLPLGDLVKVTSPGKTILDSTSPLIKLIPELSMNRNFFFDKPISRFEGHQKQFQVPFGGPEFGIGARTAYAVEQLTGQIGRGFSGYLQKPEEVDQDTKYRLPTLGISSMLKDFDAESSEYFQQRDQLQRLLDLIDFIEQQEGVRPRSVREITAGAR